MGNGRELPWLLAVALCAAVPFFVGVYSISSKTMNGFYWSSAAIAMALGLFVVFALVARHTRLIQRDMRKLATELSNLMRETREERRLAADLSAQVSVMRSQSEHLETTMHIELNNLRQAQLQVASDMRSMTDRQYQYQSQFSAQAQSGAKPAAVHPSQWRQPVTEIQAVAEPDVVPQQPALPSAAAELADVVSADDFVLSLEPVIDLFSGKTAHYRLHHAIAGSGVAIGAASAVQRPATDIMLFREALLLIKRLRRRDNRLCIFVPVSAATLASPEALSRIVSVHGAEPGISEGLVADIPHAIMANLPRTSVEGLAYLARSGVDLSLSEAAVAGLDLTALEKLNVRHVSITAGSVGNEPKQSAGIANFVQAARALHVQVVVTGVSSAQQATQLMRVARFASGSAFAEPRRVRRDAIGHAKDEVSAAAE
jgi:EAL domain-containing protein (putative c-di-GMP-specific phosphodiesterase class I)